MNIAKVEQILRPLIGRAVAADECLLSSGLIDSVSLIELIVELEASFGISIPLAELELENFDSCASIALFIQQRLAQQGAVQ